MRKQYIKETLRFYLIDCKTPLGKIIDALIIFLNLIICAIFVLETYPISAETRALLWNIEVIIVCFFCCRILPETLQRKRPIETGKGHIQHH